MVPKLIDDLGLNEPGRRLFLAKLNLIYQFVLRKRREKQEQGGAGD